MDNLPPEIQKFFKRFGGVPNGGADAAGQASDDDGRGLRVLRFG